MRLNPTLRHVPPSSFSIEAIVTNRRELRFEPRTQHSPLLSPLSTGSEPTTIAIKGHFLFFPHSPYPYCDELYLSPSFDPSEPVKGFKPLNHLPQLFYFWRFAAGPDRKSFHEPLAVIDSSLRHLCLSGLHFSKPQRPREEKKNTGKTSKDFCGGKAITPDGIQSPTIKLWLTPKHERKNVKEKKRWGKYISIQAGCNLAL